MREVYCFDRSQALRESMDVQRVQSDAQIRALSNSLQVTQASMQNAFAEVAVALQRPEGVVGVSRVGSTAFKMRVPLLVSSTSRRLFFEIPRHQNLELHPFLRINATCQPTEQM